jgi:hypothetical protein
MRIFLLALLAGCPVTNIMEPMDEPPDEACDGPAGGAPERDFATDLEASGCQYLLTAFDEYARLTLDVPVFAEAVVEGTAAATYTLPDDVVRLTVELGCNMDERLCAEGGTPSITGTFTPTAGTITATVTRDEASGTPDGGYQSLATVTLEGVTLEDEDGASVTMDTITWTDVRLFGIDD